MDLRKTDIGSYNNIIEIKEVGAFKSTLNANLAALNGCKILAADFQASYQTRSAEENKLFAIAVANFAIGVARNVELVGTAFNVVTAIKAIQNCSCERVSSRLQPSLSGSKAKGCLGSPAAFQTDRRSESTRPERR